MAPMLPEHDTETAVFGGGCFWCTEAVFKMIDGVESVEPGYAGGRTEDPTYEEVSSGTTGHAESVRVVYDPAKVSYRTLLTIFFASHDPTTLDRQGGDIGPQYRSMIFTTTPAQEMEAEAFIEEIDASSELGDPVVTAVEPLTRFYAAEDYHNDYFAKNRDAPYCELVINPKLEKVKKEFAAMLASR